MTAEMLRCESPNFHIYRILLLIEIGIVKYEISSHYKETAYTQKYENKEHISVVNIFEDKFNKLLNKYNIESHLFIIKS